MYKSYNRNPEYLDEYNTLIYSYPDHTEDLFRDYIEYAYYRLNGLSYTDAIEVLDAVSAFIKRKKS